MFLISLAKFGQNDFCTSKTFILELTKYDKKESTRFPHTLVHAILVYYIPSKVTNGIFSSVWNNSSQLHYSESFIHIVVWA